MRAEPSGMSWLALGSQPRVPASPGGVVQALLAAEPLVVGDEVSIGADLSATKGGGGDRVGVVVGGKSTRYACVDRVSAAGQPAASTGQLVLVCMLGVAVLGTNPLTASRSLVLPSASGTPVFDVYKYGARGVSAADDTTGILEAVSLAVVGGGTVSFRNLTRYTINQPIVVASKFPVSLVSDMGLGTDTTPFHPSIGPSATFVGTALVRYQSPTAGRGDAGGGHISGLSFQDTNNPTAPNYRDRRTISLTAALDLHDFLLGLVENCKFRFIKGSAIRTEFCIQSQIQNIWAHFCGDVGKATIELANSGVFPLITQALTIRTINVEACFDAPYVRSAALNEAVKLHGAGFECAPELDPSSDQTQFEDHGFGTSVIGCHFYRGGAMACKSGPAAQVVGNVFAGHPNGDLEMSHDGAQAVGNFFYDNGGEASLPSVVISGIGNVFSDNCLSYTSGIDVSGRASIVESNVITLNRRVGLPVIDLSGVQASARGNQIQWLTAIVAGTTGIRASNGANAVEGNTIFGLQKGIDVQTATCPIIGNIVAGCTTPITGVVGWERANLVRANTGFLTENNGQAFIGAAATSVVVAHGLGITPNVEDVALTYLGAPTNNVQLYVAGTSATNITIAVTGVPGGAGIYIGWRVGIAQ